MGLPADFFNNYFAYNGRMSLGFSRGAAAMAARRFDPQRAETWEFSAFSQNGEDGIIDHLLSHVASPNRYFLEIGAADGLENNTAHLAFTRKYSGVMVEGDPVRSAEARQNLQAHNWSVDYIGLYVTPENVRTVLDRCLHADPDLFSLDIDSNDYFVMERLLDEGLRPRVVCVEYNSAFGPTASQSIIYTPMLDYQQYHPSRLYYGVSVSGWRSLFSRHGYRFVTVESRGVNAFFIDPDQVDLSVEVSGLQFAENTSQRLDHQSDWEGQFAQISGMPFHEV